MIIVQATGKTSISIGRQGENLARQVVFDLSDWITEYGPGVVELIYQRPGDERPYPVAAVREGSTLVWTVSELDTAVATTGNATGHCELRWYVGDVLAKSHTWRVWVEPAMDTPTETEPPDPEKGWVDQVLAVGAAVKAAADGAKADADRAAALAAEVAAKASQTAQDATAGAQAKEAAQTAQRLAEDAQRAAEAAKQAAEDAQSAAEQSATDADAAKQGADAALKAAKDAAAAASKALDDVQTLYQEMQTWASGVVQAVTDEGTRQVQAVRDAGADGVNAIETSYSGKVDAINTAGDTQTQRVIDEGNTQTANAKAQADAAALSADAAAQSATETGNAKTGAETAKDAAVTAQGKAEEAQRGSEAARDRAEAAAIKQPYPNAETGTWWTWDADKAAYVDSGAPIAYQPRVVEVSGAELALTLANNTEVRCADPVTALTIDGFAAGDEGRVEQWGLVFTASEDGVTVTVPDSLVWAVAEPVFTAGATYWLSVVPLGNKYLAAWTEVSNESESA